MISSGNPISRATPIIRVNTPAFPCSPGSPGQVPPVTKGNTPKLAAFQTSQATAASHSSQSANTQPTSNKDNNSFKRLDYTLPTANSSTPQAVSTLLTPAPGLQVVSLSRPFLQPQVLTAQALAHSHPHSSSACSCGRHFGNFHVYHFWNSHNCFQHFSFSHHQRLGSPRTCNNSAIFGAASSPKAPGSFHAPSIRSADSPHPRMQQPQHCL